MARTRARAPDAHHHQPAAASLQPRTQHTHNTKNNKTKLLYIDTEGFESTGRANSYDDRVFAVAAVLSSLLVYNLPETIRGSDVAKLSFAVDLAQGFYDSYGQVCVGVWRVGVACVCV